MKTLKATSRQFTINYFDLLRGLLMAAIGAAVGLIYSAILNGGIDSINWQTVLAGTLTAGLGYLIKKFFTPGEIVVVDPPANELKAVKENRATVKIESKPV